MIFKVRVFQTTLIRQQDQADRQVEMAMVACRSMDGSIQFSMQVKPDTAPLVGDFFDLSVSPAASLGERIGDLSGSPGLGLGR